MTMILFYEKPGCTNNTKQKLLLAAAGHKVCAKSLLTENWTAERLMTFFGTRPVAEWFNRSSPKVKSGEVVPEQMQADKALEMMLADPLLIRRPLIVADGRYEVGFESTLIESWLGLTNKDKQDLETCVKIHETKPYPEPDKTIKNKSKKLKTNLQKSPQNPRAKNIALRAA
ncbi:MAG TPA: ArsC/Spx/MgsR family protein [Methylotenera sp.]|nr:ArsC/Spx/MgsR family protein [Methylotenera sp.]HPH04902.1 ArsC/Spx/MgsR family protein [Methylotenera sp.]